MTEDLEGMVRGAVVDDDDLHLRPVESQGTLDRLVEEVAVVVIRDDDAEPFQCPPDLHRRFR